MEFEIKKSWLDLSEHKLHALFTRQKLPQNIVAGRVALITRMKAERKAERLKTRTHDRLWKELLDPAREELVVVRTMKSKLKRAPESPAIQFKYEVLHAYDTAITRVVERLRKVQIGKVYTPKQLAKMLRNEKKLPEDATGDHWTEFVMPGERVKIEAMFARLPDPIRGRKKVPFEKRLSMAERKRRRAALWDSIQAAIDTEEVRLRWATDEAQRAEILESIDKMEQAKFKLTQLGIMATLPDDWRNL